MLAVVEALFDAGYDRERVDELRATKREARGGFADGVVLERVEDRD